MLRSRSKVPKQTKTESGKLGGYVQEKPLPVSQSQADSVLNNLPTGHLFTGDLPHTIRMVPNSSPHHTAADSSRPPQNLNSNSPGYVSFGVNPQLEDDFEALEPESLPIGAGIPPPKEPQKDKALEDIVSGLYYQLPDKEGERSGFRFYPENVYESNNWTDLAALEMAVWTNDDLVDFAKQLAGRLFPKMEDNKAIERVLTGGFEQLHDLIDLTRQKGELPSFQNSTLVNPPDPTSNPALFPVDEASTRKLQLLKLTRPFRYKDEAGYTEALDRLYRLSRIVAGSGLVGVDVIKYANYLERRAERREEAYEKWFTFPMKLKESMFTQPVASAITSALSDVAYVRAMDNPDYSELFSSILMSTERFVFADLITLIYIEKNSKQPTQYTTRFSQEDTANKKRTCLERLGRSQLRPNPSVVNSLPKIPGLGQVKRESSGFGSPPKRMKIESGISLNF